MTRRRAGVSAGELLTSLHVPLYRTGDLEDLAAHPGIDWQAIRSTPKGRRSPLAGLRRAAADSGERAQ